MNQVPNNNVSITPKVRSRKLTFSITLEQATGTSQAEVKQFLLNALGLAMLESEIRLIKSETTYGGKDE